jgi:hypothetical protein
MTVTALLGDDHSLIYMWCSFLLQHSRHLKSSRIHLSEQKPCHGDNLEVDGFASLYFDVNHDQQLKTVRCFNGCHQPLQRTSCLLLQPVELIGGCHSSVRFDTGEKCASPSLY